MLRRKNIIRSVMKIIDRQASYTDKLPTHLLTCSYAVEKKEDYFHARDVAEYIRVLYEDLDEDKRKKLNTLVHNSLKTLVNTEFLEKLAVRDSNQLKDSQYKINPEIELTDDFRLFLIKRNLTRIKDGRKVGSDQEYIELRNMEKKGDKIYETNKIMHNLMYSYLKRFIEKSEAIYYYTPLGFFRLPGKEPETQSLKANLNFIDFLSKVNGFVDNHRDNFHLIVRLYPIPLRCEPDLSEKFLDFIASCVDTNPSRVRIELNYDITRSGASLILKGEHDIFLTGEYALNGAYNFELYTNELKVKREIERFTKRFKNPFLVQIGADRDIKQEKFRETFRKLLKSWKILDSDEIGYNNRIKNLTTSFLSTEEILTRMENNQ